MKLSKDLGEFIELLNSRKMKCLLIGGHAVAYHGFPRDTADVDFFILIIWRNLSPCAELPYAVKTDRLFP
jgi:hypothetical protein